MLFLSNVLSIGRSCSFDMAMISPYMSTKFTLYSNNRKVSAHVITDGSDPIKTTLRRSLKSLPTIRGLIFLGGTSGTKTVSLPDCLSTRASKIGILSIAGPCSAWPFVIL